MSATATSTATVRNRPSSSEPAIHRPPVRNGHPADLSARTPAAPERGGIALFQVPFASAMSDCDLALLGRTLDLVTHMYAKMSPDPNSPGVVRLDHYSGLFLERGEGQGQWVFEARTWGHPAPQSVHEWHLLAADAARQLDATVPFPERLPASAGQTPDHLVGRAAKKRLAGIRRRFVGLP